jgi:hypothetical protein
MWMWKKFVVGTAVVIGLVVFQPQGCLNWGRRSEAFLSQAGITVSFSPFS